MIYQSVSIENVISKVIRETKVQDTSAIMELYEVIPDAIGMLQTRFQLHQTFRDLRIHFHKAQLPPGMIVGSAVEWKGHRLPWRHSARAIDAPYRHHSDQWQPGGIAPVFPPLDVHTDDLSSNVFLSTQTENQNPVDGMHFITWTIEDLDRLSCHHNAYYWIEMGYISTSFSEGYVRVHYYEAPKDENGNLLIPDNSNYREALYYFCRAKLIGMGAFEDKIIGEEKCQQRFEHYGGRAIDEIDYPTEDQMQQIAANQVRLIPPLNYWQDFGGNKGTMHYG